MSRKFASLVTAVESLIKDSDTCTNSDDRKAAVRRALSKLSDVRPQIVICDLTGDGNANVFLLPETFEKKFSTIIRIQYPFDVTGAKNPQSIDLDNQRLIDVGDRTFKLKLDFTPASGETVRALFTAHHCVTDEDENFTTLDDSSDEEAVINWAAGECLLMMAAKAVAVGDSTIGADTVAYQSRESQYKSLAKFYFDKSGLEDAPAMVYAQVQVKMLSGESYLTHA